MNKSPKERRPGRPNKNEVANLKQALLLAAIELFGARGFDGVSLSQIASQAGADIGLTRYYFGSKADLWEAAMGLLAENFMAALAAHSQFQHRSKTDDLKSVIRAFIHASAEWPQVSRIIVFDGNKTDDRGTFIANRLVKPFFDMISNLIAGAKSEGTIPTVSDRTIFFMVTHGGSFPMALPALTNALPGGDINSAKALTVHADAIIALILRPAEAARP